MTSLNKSLKEAFKILLSVNSGNGCNGIKTGFTDLDNLLRGMEKGTLTVFSARPSLGKTAFALNIVNNCAVLPQKLNILFCSDLSHTELTFRLLAIASGIRKKGDAEYCPGDTGSLTAAVEKFKDYPLHFCEHDCFDEAFFDKVRAFYADNRWDLLIADNAHPEDCRKLKMLARKLNIAVLAFVPLYSPKDILLSRGVADTLVTLLRDREESKNSDGVSPVEFFVSKNKNGICGTCRLNFIPETMLFKPVSIANPTVE